MSIADALEAKKTLIDVFGFKEEDIVLLVDEEGGTDQPTQDRILQELQDFVEPNDSNVDYVFIYVGHAYQSDAKSEKGLQEEEDGKSEYIIPLDCWSPWNRTPIVAKAIYDYTLRSYLVDRLGDGSKLLAIFNTCHSGTLLNLRHYKCHRCGKLTSLVRRLGRKGFCDPFQMSVVRETSASDQCASIFSRLVPWRIRSALAKAGDLCTGLCHTESSGFKYPRVVCISGCKDSEMTVESNKEPSMLASLMTLFRKNPRPTFLEIMDDMRTNVKRTRFECGRNVEHTSSEAATIFNSKRDFLATLSHLCRHISTKLKSWHPELAAEHPIDMKQKLIVCLP
jgi:hypothetical protein